MRRYRVFFLVQVLDHQLIEQIRALLLADPELEIVVAPEQGIDKEQWRHSGMDELRDRLWVHSPPSPSSPIGRVRYLLQLASALVRRRVSLVDVHMGLSIESKAAWMLSRISRVPLTLHMYGRERDYLKASGLPPRERRWLERVVAAADLVFCHDKSLVETLKAMRGPDARHYLLYNGTRCARAEVPRDTQAIRARLGIGRSDHVILYNHRIMGFKRPVTYLRALAEVIRRHPSGRFVFVGPKRLDTPLGKEVQELVSALGLGSRTIWIDRRISGSEMEDIYAITDVAVNISELVVPSLSTLEAMSFGVPLVISNEVDSNLYVEHGVNGMIVRPDPPEVADAIAELLSDPVRRRAMGAASRERARQFFDIDGWARRTVGCYRSVVFGEPPPAPQLFEAPVHGGAGGA